MKWCFIFAIAAIATVVSSYSVKPPPPHPPPGPYYDPYWQPPPDPNYHRYHRPGVHYHYHDGKYEEVKDADNGEEDSSEEETDEHAHSASHEDEDMEHSEPEKVWRFQMGDDMAGYEYIDEDGYLHGFTIDLMNAVCKHAGKRCHYIFDKSKRCWETSGAHEYPGIGLQAGLYDACLNLLPSPPRLNSFNFTMAYTPNMKEAIHFREGDDSAGTNLTGKRVGFVDGWCTSQKCLEIQPGFEGNTHGAYEAVMFDTYRELKVALYGGKIDAAILASTQKGRKGLKAVEPEFRCSVRGLSAMAPYGSELIEWWNKAFVEMRITGEFHRLCEAGEIKHAAHGPLFCI